MLRAAGVHEVEEREVQKLVERAKGLADELEGASDAIVEANALVTWGDQLLDRAIERFAGDVVHLVGGDRSDLRYTGFFREAPGEYIRLGLESEIERTAHFLTISVYRGRVAKIIAEKRQHRIPNCRVNRRRC
jgi:hypothetical protein